MRRGMIKLEHISKEYTLGKIGTGSLMRDLQSRRAKRRGQDDPNIKLGRLPKVGATIRALDDLSFSVDEGERVGIIGANGAGKTTLLRVISQITSPTEGSLYLNGRVASLLEVGTGFHMELTGRENIYLNGAVLGMKREYIDERLEEIIDFSECRSFIDTPVKRYSSGMLVRLGFAVAAHLDSEILIMDEVLAVGDAKFQRKCIETMQRMSREERRTILYVSHVLPTVIDLCDRCLVMERGRVVFDGAPEEAVQVYLSIQMRAQQNQYSFDGVSREAIFAESGTALRSLEIVDAEGEIRFRILWDNALENEELFFRMVVHHQNGDIVGIADSLALDNGQGEALAAEISFDTKMLAPGNYYFYPQLLARRGAKVLILDAPWQTILFECPFLNALPSWDHRMYGHIPFEKLRVKE